MNDDELSLPKSVEVDEIIEFYKNRAPEENTEQTEETEEMSEDGIQSKVYGLSLKGRMTLYRIISAVISAFIIICSFVLAYFLPGNEDIVAEQKEQMRNEEDYASLKSRHDALKTEVDNLKTSNSEKEEKLEKIADIDNPKAELRSEIEKKTYELNELNAQIKEKRSTIESLDASIAEKAPPEIQLPPGKYVVGKNIAKGKYRVTGVGKFMLSSSNGKSKINTTLGSTPIDVTLEDNDILKFESKVKFVSAN